MLKHHGWIETQLQRPESVAVLADGAVLASHRHSVIVSIAKDGRQKELSSLPHDGFVPNGIAARADGSILVTDMGERGGVWLLPDGSETVEPFLLAVDGKQLPPSNFVLVDGDRIWVTIRTRTLPINQIYNTDEADGFVVLIDQNGARIVADGLQFANECRVSVDGKWVFVAETAGARVSRFSLSADGVVGPRETFCQLDDYVYPEGLLLDKNGGLWLTSVISNRIYRLDAQGNPTLEFDDGDQEHVRTTRHARSQRALVREHFYEGAGQILSAPTSLAFLDVEQSKIVVGSLLAERLAVFSIE